MVPHSSIGCGSRTISAPRSVKADAKRLFPTFAVFAVLVVFLVVPPLLGQTSPDVPSVKDRFEFLHNSLHELSQDYTNDVFKTIGFLLLAIGWIVTSQHSREFIGSRPIIRWAGLTSIAVAVIVHVALVRERFLVSSDQWQQLSELGFMPSAYYADDRITPIVFWATLVLHLALFAMLMVLVYRTDTESRHG